MQTYFRSNRPHYSSPFNPETRISLVPKRAEHGVLVQPRHVLFVSN